MSLCLVGHHRSAPSSVIPTVRAWTVSSQSVPTSINPNPTFFRPREASEPYSRGQWDSALKATPHSPEGDVSYVGALERTACSDAHGFRLAVLACCCC